MALATKCPHCGTVFKVAADQLKLRGGIVRCGKCSEIFDGNASLVDPEAALPRPLPAPESADAAPEPAAEEETPVYTLDFDTTFDHLGIIPKAAAEEAPEAEAAAPEPTPQLDIDFDLDLVPPPAAPAEAERPVPPEAEGTVPTGLSPALESPDPNAAEAEETVPTGLSPALESPDPNAADAEGTVPTGLSPALESPDPDAAEVEGTVPTGLSPALESPNPDAAEAEGTVPTGLSPVFAPPEPEAEPVTPTADLEPEPEPEPEPAPHPSPIEDAEGAELVPGAMASESSHAEEPLHAQDDTEEPGFVTRVRKKEKTRRITRILMSVASVLLLAGLLAQGVISFASVLAARYPHAKPTLIEACKLLRCQVTLPAQIDKLAVETGELQTIADNSFLFATVLRNDSTLAQAWPHIELALTDSADKTLVRRVIKPAEYLPRIDASRGFAAKTEQPVKVYFQLSGVTASGYHIAIFYP